MAKFPSPRKKAKKISALRAPMFPPLHLMLGSCVTPSPIIFVSFLADPPPDLSDNIYILALSVKFWCLIQQQIQISVHRWPHLSTVAKKPLPNGTPMA